VASPFGMPFFFLFAFLFPKSSDVDYHYMVGGWWVYLWKMRPFRFARLQFVGPYVMSYDTHLPPKKKKRNNNIKQQTSKRRPEKMPALVALSTLHQQKDL
jgi:hypothetical protein